MLNDELKRLEHLIADALRLDPEDRDDFLTRNCSGNAALLAGARAALAGASRSIADSAGNQAEFLEKAKEILANVSPPRNGAPKSDDAPAAYAAHKSEPATESVDGKVIGPYILRRKLGEGGMGIVYLADDTRLSRRVALKAITPGLGREPERRARMRHEARAAAVLSHPGVATVYALEEIDGELYLACEFVPGEPLRAILASGPRPIAEIVTTGAQLARALAAAHTLGVIHRDIKPENIMKTPSGAVKILDFGLARMEDPQRSYLTDTGVVVGTPAYMAPEQAQGEHVDSRTDVFAVGLVLYELTTGVNPFIAKTLSATHARIVNEEPPPISTLRPDCIPELDRIIATCLRKKPAERYGSTQELVADFEALEAEVASLRVRPPDRGGPRVPSGTARPPGAPGPPEPAGEPGPPLLPPPAPRHYWWEFHQLIISAIYVLMIYPAWYVQRWLLEPWGMLFLLVVLAAAAAGTSLRLHLVFVARHSAGELPAQLPQTRKLTRACDAVFAGSQLAGAIAVVLARSPESPNGHPEFAMLFVVIAMVIVVAALVIEPTTEKGAFGPVMNQRAA